MAFTMALMASLRDALGHILRMYKLMNNRTLHF